MSKKLKVLISAYACEPNKGSEPEVGWQWALQMARFHDVTVITRENNRFAIEQELANLRGKQSLPSFIYHDEKPILLHLKQRFKAVRMYYILWQQSVWEIIARLTEEQTFDLIHHVTFAGFRYRTAIWEHGVPSVWGPIGGIESIPFSLLPWTHPKSLIAEIIRNVNNFIQAAPIHVLPRRAMATTTTLVSTHEMKRTFFNLGFETTLMPTIGLHVSKTPFLPRKAIEGPLKILFVGNVITLKGIDLAIHALHQSGIDATFTLVGDGNYLEAAKKLVRRLGMEKRVEFRGRMPRREVLAMYSHYDLFLFPSLHDTGGYAVIEAMSHGVPVICLDCGGPRVSVKKGAGIQVSLGSRKEVIQGLASALQRYDRNRDMLIEHGRAAREVVLSDYDWDKKGEQLNSIYQKTANAKIPAAAPPNKSLRKRVNSPSGKLNKVLRRMFPIKGLAVSAVIFLIIGTLGFLSVEQLKSKAQLIVKDTLPGLSNAGAADSNLAEAFNRTLLVVMSEDTAEQARYRDEMEEFSQKADEYLQAYQSSIYSADDRMNYNNLVEVRKVYRELRGKTLQLVDQQKHKEALALCKTSLMPAYRDYKRAGEKLLEYNTIQGKSRGETIMRICTVTQYFVAVIGIALFLAGFIIGMFK
ncbi:glycosyltransferase [Pedosphaera parvula]|uniref:Glycosyl transferase group 1 n=1 Tax=Pedosphaera parvula (strain Ellin514) TaxID=320771 RepID=B9XSC3_PEDPL|nr:glycosyltransferase [Pedosphaera parvula]EEF57256.1 glycosyl transferase group 1 [Pedosphaera parvula Ellin514]